MRGTNLGYFKKRGGGKQRQGEHWKTISLVILREGDEIDTGGSSPLP